MAQQQQPKELDLSSFKMDEFPFRIPLEPTHVIAVGDLEAVRQSVHQSLVALGAIRGEAVGVIDDYEVWVPNSMVVFCVLFKRPEGAAGDGGTAGAWVVEFKKLYGSTVDFLDYFVSCLRYFRDRYLRDGCSGGDGTTSDSQQPPQHVTFDEGSLSSWLNHQHELDTTRLPPLLLINHLGGLDETMSPVLAMLTSPWTTSQLEGLTSVAQLTETLSNASILANYRPLLVALGHMDVRHWRSRHMCRCFARVVANLITAPIPDPESASALMCVTLAACIQQVHGPHRNDPLWHHVTIEVARFRNAAHYESIVATHLPAVEGTPKGETTESVVGGPELPVVPELAPLPELHSLLAELHSSLPAAPPPDHSPLPAAPELPAQPAAPELPAQPAAPELPAQPAAPELPAPPVPPAQPAVVVPVPPPVPVPQ